MYRFVESKRRFFSAAKNRARKQAAELVPEKWNYKIKSYEARYLVSGRVTKDLLWSIHFDCTANKTELGFNQWTTIDFFVCSEDFNVNYYTYTVTGNSYVFENKDFVPISSRLKGLEDDIEKMKICVSKILEVMNPKNFDEGTC